MRKIYIIAILVLLVGLVLLLFQRSQQTSSVSANNSAETIAVTIDGLAFDSFISQPGSNGQNLSSQPLHEIQLGQISRLDKLAASYLIIFKDGSELQLSSSMLADIAPEIRLRLEYDRAN